VNEIETLVRFQQPSQLPVLPSQDEWAGIAQMAKMLVASELIPKALRQLRDPVAGVAYILLAGRDLGIRPTLALSRIHIIDGKPSMSAELMVALVRRAGHKVRVPVTTAMTCTAEGHRAEDEPDVWQSVTYTLDEARAAGITGKDNWKHYPAAMLRARAISGLCRITFADVLMGVTYLPEELGEHGEVVDVYESPPVALASPEVIVALRAAIDALDSVDQDALRIWWTDSRLPSLKSGRLTAEQTTEIFRWCQDLPHGDESWGHATNDDEIPSPPPMPSFDGDGEPAAAIETRTVAGPAENVAPEPGGGRDVPADEEKKPDPADVANYEAFVSDQDTALAVISDPTWAEASNADDLRKRIREVARLSGLPYENQLERWATEQSIEVPTWNGKVSLSGLRPASRVREFAVFYRDVMMAVLG